jgi:hypothetical protein
MRTLELLTVKRALLILLLVPAAALALSEAHWVKYWVGAENEDDSVAALVCDVNGDVYVTGAGWRAGEDYDVTVAKYNEQGTELWRSFFSGSAHQEDGGVGIVIDHRGGVYVVATTRENVGGVDHATMITTIKYDAANGSRLWVKYFEGQTGWYDDQATGIAYDSVGLRLYVCGSSYCYDNRGWDYDVSVVCYDPGTGNMWWSKLCDSDISHSLDDYCAGICLGPNRNPVLAISSPDYYQDETREWVALCLSAVDGGLVWRRAVHWDAENDDEEPLGICADALGSVYLTGYRYDDEQGEYQFAMAKISSSGSSTRLDSITVDAENDGWGVKCRYAGGKVYAIGWFDDPRNAGTDEDWGVLGFDTTCGAGSSRRLSQEFCVFFDGGSPRSKAGFSRRHTEQRTQRTGHGKRKAGAVLEVPEPFESEAPTDLAFDPQGRVYVAGYMRDSTDCQQWVVRRIDDRFNPRVPDTLWDRYNDQHGLFFRRNSEDNNRPYCLGVLDSNHIYVGGYVMLDSTANTIQTLMRFGNLLPISGVLDSLKPLPSDTVDSGSVILPPEAFFRNNGAVVNNLDLYLALDSLYYDTFRCPDLNPGQSDTAWFDETNYWRVGLGQHVLKCTLKLKRDSSPGNNLIQKQVHVRSYPDVGVQAILWPVGDTINFGAMVWPRARVVNYGRVPTTYRARFTLGPDSVFSYVADMLPADTWDLTGERALLPAPGPLAVKCSTELYRDTVPANDRAMLPSDVFIRDRDLTCTQLLGLVGPYDPGDTATPSGWVKNEGNVRALNACAFLRIGSDVYLDSVPIPKLAIGESVLVQFRTWHIIPPSRHHVWFYCRCPDDVDARNDTIHIRVQVRGHDVGVEEIVAPREPVYPGERIPQLRVANLGTFPETLYAFYGIEPSGYQKWVRAELAPGADSVLTFPAWNAVIGAYSRTCSVHVALDGYATNNCAKNGFVVHPITYWMSRADVPVGSFRRGVKDGGSLSALTRRDTACVYALKGSSRCDFYRFNVAANTWQVIESIPATGSSGKRKTVKKGASLSAGPNELFAAKGGSTNEWWMYDPNRSGSPDYPWIQRTSVPTGSSAIKSGSGSCAINIGDTTFIYLLKGSSTLEFYRYNTATGVWQSRFPAPSGVSGKAFKDGSCITASDDGRTVYALKGYYSEFFAYSVDSNRWRGLSSLPTGSSGKRAKGGASIAFCPGPVPVIRALKGNNTLEFWSYSVDSDSWTKGLDLPSGNSGRRVKGGGALAYSSYDKALYALKGNNTLEFWRYRPETLLVSAAHRASNAQAAPAATQQSSFTVNPSIVRNQVTIAWSRVHDGPMSVKLFDVSGKLVAVLASGRVPRAASVRLVTSGLPRGVYLLSLSAPDGSFARKLVVE